MDLSNAHLHLMLNHIPVVGTGLVLLLLVIALAKRSRELTLTAFALTALVAVSAPIVKATGEEAEEQVEDATWFDKTTKDLAHEHEESGEKAAIALMIAGVAALAAMFLARGGKPVRPAVAFGVTGLLLVASLLMAWTALSGGEIRHDEIRPGGAAAPAPSSAEPDDGD